MFYYKNWEKFCQTISKENAHSLTAQDLLKHDSSKQFIVFKHDVETSPSRALRLAEIEHKFGIQGSYYVQAYLLKNDINTKILKKIQDLGHEVSYHYDVLDANDGNFELAERDFDFYLEKFQSSGFKFETICQHGNPVKKRVGYNSNRDFFRNQDIRNKYNHLSDVVVDFKEKSGKNYSYISDAGYSWKLIGDPENNDRIKNSIDISLKDFDGVLNHLRQGNSIILSTHPHRWRKTAFGIYMKMSFFKAVRSTVNISTKIPLIKSILNRFYFLAKNI